MVDTFEKVGGKFEGFRRSGAKGVCASAEFVGSAQGRALSVSSAFSGQAVPVIARFSIGRARVCLCGRQRQETVGQMDV